MSDVDGRPSPTPCPRVDRAPGAAIPGDAELPDRLCPHVLTRAGWRSPAPTAGQRCTAISPPARLSTEKQARLCLTAAHPMCATFVAAGDARLARGLHDGAARRAIARTAPVVVERARPRALVDLDSGVRRWGQAGLVLLMLVALVAVVVVRSSGRPPAPAGAVGGNTPSAAAAATGSSATAATSGGTKSSPTAPSPSPRPSVSAAASGRPQTYTVRKGDTLSGIAARFGTTAAAIRKANRLSSSSPLRVGLVLTIP